MTQSSVRHLTYMHLSAVAISAQPHLNANEGKLVAEFAFKWLNMYVWDIWYSAGGLTEIWSVRMLYTNMSWPHIVLYYILF